MTQEQPMTENAGLERHAEAIRDGLSRRYGETPDERDKRFLAACQALRDEGRREGIEAAAEKADYEQELSQDNINEGYDIKFNNPAEKISRRIARSIRAIDPTSIGEP